MLGKSRNNTISFPPKDIIGTEIVTKLTLQKVYSRCTGQQESFRLEENEREKDSIKSLLNSDEEYDYTVHAMALKVQNEWITLGEICVSPALNFALKFKWTPTLLKYVNIFQGYICGFVRYVGCVLTQHLLLCAGMTKFWTAQQRALLIIFILD